MTADSGIVTEGDSGNVTNDSGERDRYAGHGTGTLVHAVGTVLRMNKPGGPVASLLF